MFKAYWLEERPGGSWALRVEQTKGGERTLNLCYDERLAWRICDMLRKDIDQKAMDNRDYRLKGFKVRSKGQQTLKLPVSVDSSPADFAAHLLGQLKRKHK